MSLHTLNGTLPDLFTWAAGRYAASLGRSEQLQSRYRQHEALIADQGHAPDEAERLQADVRAGLSYESQIQMLLRDLGREIVGGPGRHECDCEPFGLEDFGYCICGRSPEVGE